MIRLHDPDLPSRAATDAAAQRTGLAVAHLACVAALLHAPPAVGMTLWLSNWHLAAVAGMLACSAAMYLVAPGSRWRRLRTSLIPAVCVPARSDGFAWLPWLGWRRVDDPLRDEIQRRASVPMVAVALLVLPLLAAEHFFESAIAESAWLRAGVAAASAAVWATFALEFLVGCKLAESRWTYCKTHWLDLAIILLPLVAFLRAARLARLASLQEAARVYRLRGVVMKVWRAIILFDLISRLLRRSPEKRAEFLERRRTELLMELAEIDERLGDLRNAA